MTTFYDRGLLYERLYEVADLAGELHYVDAVLAFAAAENQPAGPGGGPLPQYFELNNIGWTYPFNRRILKAPMPFGYQEQVSGALTEAAGQAQTWRDSNLESLLQLIEPFTHPTTDHYDEIVQALEISHATLETKPELASVPPPEGTTAIRRPDFGLLNPDRWEGEGGRSFRDRFYTPFEEQVRPYQAGLTRSIAAGFVRAKGIHDLAQLSLMDAVTSVRDALHEQLRHRQQDRDDVSKAEALLITSIAAGALAVISTPVPPLSVSFLAINAALGYAASETTERDGAREKEEVTGRTAEELLFGLYDLILIVVRNSRIQHDALDADMAALMSWLDHRHKEEVLVPSRPNIANRDNTDRVNPNPDTFRHRP